MIVGTGAAGLYAALQFEKDVRVLLVCKKELTLSNSSLAQGGVAAVIDKNHDDFKLHIADTLISGGYKNDLSSLEVLVTEGPDDVLHLKDLGVDFDLDDKGQLQMTLEAGHSRRRIVHHKDSTGRAIVDKLLSYVTTYSNIDILENAMLFSLHPAENGFYAEILHNDEALQIGTRFCLLATGGIGRV